tara:strand:- start:330 stop:2168 length:1839 start_codon:yes stop_codon:yes gene_type:complete
MANKNRYGARIPKGMYDTTTSSSYPTKGSVYPTFVDYGKIMGEAFEQGMESLIEYKKEKEDEYKENALQSPIKTDIDFDKVPENWTNSITAALETEKLNYANANKTSRNYEIGSDGYRQGQEGMAVAKNNIEKLNNKLTALATMYQQHDEFVWSGSYSKGQNGIEKEWFFNLMKRDHENMDFSNGTITWKNIELADGTFGDFNVDDLKFPNFIKPDAINGLQGIQDEVREFAASDSPLSTSELNIRFNNLLTNPKVGWDGAKSLAYDVLMDSQIEGGSPSSFAKWYTGGIFDKITGKFIPFSGADINQDGVISDEEKAQYKGEVKDINKDGVIDVEEMVAGLGAYGIQSGYDDGLYSHLGATPGKYTDWMLDPAMSQMLRQELSKYYGSKLKNVSDNVHEKWRQENDNSVDAQNAVLHGYEFPGEQNYFNTQYRNNLKSLVNFVGVNKSNIIDPKGEPASKVDTHTATPQNLEKLARKVSFMLSSKKLTILTYDAALRAYLSADEENTEKLFLAEPYNNGEKQHLYMEDANGNFDSFNDINLETFFTDSDSFITDLTNHQLRWWDQYPRSNFQSNWATLKSRTKPGEYVNKDIIKLLEDNLFFDPKKYLDPK